MKKLLFISFSFAFSILATETPSASTQTDPTEQYRNKKAHEAILHDAYYEAKKYTDPIPKAWKEAVEAFGFKEEDIEFYTAVRFNKFTERCGNKIIILYPNFFLYLTDAEQKAYIGLKLASLKAGVEFDVEGSHGTFYKPKGDSFKKISIGLTAAGLLALYHKDIFKAVSLAVPHVKNIVFSKGAGLIAAAGIANIAHENVKEHKKIKQFNEAQFEVIDKLGAEGILSIREKQVNWGRTKASWIERKWNYLLGKLSLVYSPEANLELIKEYIAKKDQQQEASN